MMNPLTTLLAAAGAEPPAPAAAGEIELTLWKWVIIIGVGAVILFWGVKRVAEVVVKRRTEAMVREVGGKDETDAG